MSSTKEENELLYNASSDETPMFRVLIKQRKKNQVNGNNEYLQCRSSELNENGAIIIHNIFGGLYVINK